MDFSNLLDQTSEAALTVIRGIKSDQFENPTPCEGWDVKKLMNHLIGSCKFFTSRALGEEPEPRKEVYTEDFGEAQRELETLIPKSVEAWKTPGALEKMVQAPMGEVKGEFLAGITTNEFLIHGWDLAKATNQQIQIDDKIAGEVLELAKQRMTPQTRGKAFGPQQPTPENASNLERLMAFMGRKV